MQTNLARTVEITYKEAQLDNACKKVLSDKNILAWILKTTVKEYENESIQKIRDEYIEGDAVVSKVYINPGETNSATKEEYKEINPEITGRNNESNILNEGEFTFDIIFYALIPGTSERAKLIINIEAQGRYYQSYEFQTRGIYYCSRMISSQYGKEFTDSHYENINKVYSIWICINPPKCLRNTITSFDIRKEDVVGSVDVDLKSYDLLSVKIIRLGKETDTKSSEIIRLLETLLSNEKNPEEKKKILREEYKIPLEKSSEEEVGNMSNIGSYLVESTWEKAMAQGIEQGLEQGLERGKETQLINMVCKKLRKNKTPEMISDELDEDIKVINNICRLIETKTEYDSDKIYEMLHEDCNYGSK